MLPRSRSSQSGAAVTTSGIEGLPVHCIKRLAHGFVKGRMRVNGVPQRFHCGFGFHGQNAFPDQLVSFRTNDMDAQDFAILGVGDDFDEAVVLPQDAGLAVGGEGEFAYSEVVTRRARLRLREPDAADTRLRISGSRDAVLIHRSHRLACDVRDRHHAFGRGHMGKLRRARHNIADGVNARLAGALKLVHFNETPVELHTRAFEADVIRVRLAPDGNQQSLRFHGFILAVRQSRCEAHAGISSLDVAHLGAGFDANAALLEVALQILRDVLVFHRHNARQHLKHTDVRTEAVEAGCELDTYGARAQDRQRFRDVVQIQNFDIGEDALGIRLQSGEHARLRAGSQHDVLEFDDLRARVGGDFQLSGARQTAVALDHVHLVFLHQELDALGVLGDDLVLALEDQRKIQTRILTTDAVFNGVLEMLPNIRRTQERFGWNAAYMQAAAAQFRVFFNDRDLQAILPRTNGG